MNRSVIAGAGAVTFFLGLAGGWLTFRGPPEPVESAEAASERARLTVENAELKKELERLRADILSSAQRNEDFLAQLAETKANLASAEEAAETEPAPPEPSPRSDPGLPYTLASVDEADAILTQALADGDPQALWELAAVLLSMGEEGYEKLLALFQRLSGEAKKHDVLEAWFDDELLAGRFIRAVANSQDDVLRFLLYLQKKDPATLPREVASLQREILGEGGAVVLGFYDGDDPQVHDGFVPLYAKQLEKTGRERQRAGARQSRSGWAKRAGGGSSSSSPGPPLALLGALEGSDGG